MENGEKLLQKYASRIKQDFPNLEIKTIKILGEGWFNVAVLVNGELVFRMPGKHLLEPHETKTEIELLKSLDGKLPVAIPQPRYIAPDLSYFGYPLLKGVLAIEVNLTNEEKEAYRRQWVEIVDTIQRTIPRSRAEALGIQNIVGYYSQSIDDTRRIHQIPGIGKEILDFAEETIKQVIPKNKPQVSWSVIHSDIHMLNTLVDEKDHKITGVLDWTGCRIGPLEVEFSVWEWDKAGELEATAKVYEQKTGTKVNINEARMWRHIDELSDLVQAYETSDEKEFHGTKSQIERWISQEK